MLPYDKNFILMMLQLRGKISLLHNRLTQIQFNIQNVYSCIENLFTSTINPTLISSSDLQYLLYGIKDQLQLHPRLYLPANIELDIWNYYKFLKIQAFILMVTLCVIWTIPLVDKGLTFHLYRIKEFKSVLIFCKRMMRKRSVNTVGF